MHASLKTPSEKPSGKKRFYGEKSTLHTQDVFARIASLKTLCEKTSNKNSLREKEYNTQPSWFIIFKINYSSGILCV